MRIALALFFVVSLIVVVSGHVHNHVARKHLLKRGDALVNGTTYMEKRYDSARFSYYAAGLGACGKTNSASDFIVALNSAQFDSGHYCFEMITISYGGKSTQAQITDRCPGCPYGGLDFSQGLFEYFASTDQGIIYGQWDFSNGNSGPPPTTSRAAPKHTWTPTSTIAAPTSTQTSQTTTSSSGSSAASSASTTKSSASAVSETASPSAPAVPGTIEQFNLAIMGLESLISNSQHVA